MRRPDERLAAHHEQPVQEWAEGIYDLLFICTVLPSSTKTKPVNEEWKRWRLWNLAGSTL